MSLLTADAVVKGNVTGEGGTLLVKHLGDWRSAVFPWRAGGSVRVADSAFSVGATRYPAGTYIVDNSSRVRDAVTALGINGVAIAAAPRVKSHTIALPRIALMHSWIETQNEGWVRFAFDQMGIPYTYISDQSLTRSGALDRFDVVVFPHVSGSTQVLINGRPKIGPPVPWRKTASTPNLGRWDETNDVRQGMGMDGAATLKRFVERGGLLITSGNSSRLPVDLGFSTSVSIPTTTRLNARGAIYRAQPVATASPILYGYDSPSFPVYFNQQPLFNVTPRDTTIAPEGQSPAIAAERERMRAKVILKFHQTVDSLLISGLLAAGDEMNGKAAVVDAPVGRGHVVLFGIRPMWRWQSQGSFALALNAIANWNHLEF
jgi:hypothetical protein